jgi:hypothetical protein
MIEFIDDRPNQKSVCKSDKMTTDIIIQKSQDGFIFFEIKFERGSVPAELAGRYSDIPNAKKAVTKYLANKKETKAARRENFNAAREERKKRDGSENITKGRKHIRKGSDN